MFFWLNSLLIDALGKAMAYVNMIITKTKGRTVCGWGVLGQEAEEERIGCRSSKRVGSRINRC